MTELEKAACYVQLLKQEGKLDETALPELIGMYKISRQEAIDLVESYKETEAYRKNVTDHLKEKTVQLVIGLLACCAFLYMAFSEYGNSLFYFHAVIFFVSALAALIYLFKLLKERYGKKKSLLPDNNSLVINEYSNSRTKRKNTSWIENKAIPVCLILLIILFYEQKNLDNKSYLLETHPYEKYENLILSADCSEKSEGRKNQTYFYEIKTEDYSKTFKWYSSRHYYAFNTLQAPDKLLHKGDTINVLVIKTRDINYFTIHDIQKTNQWLLDLAKRNEFAKQDAVNQRNIFLILFLVSLAAVLLNHFLRRMQFP